MQRGVVKLTRNEANALNTFLEGKIFGEVPLTHKLTALFEALSIANNEDEFSIELSVDELELLMDAVILPTDDDPEYMPELRRKLSQSYLVMRAD